MHSPPPKFKQPIARRRLGQNYINNQALLTRIAASTDVSDKDLVIEIGSGPAGLTKSLLARGARAVLAIEKDARFIDNLEAIATQWPERLFIFHMDALGVRLPSDEMLKLKSHLEAKENQQLNLKIVGNLPFNIGTKLLTDWICQTPRMAFESITVMLQREVADRILAAPSTPEYGRLAIICQLLCKVERKFDVGADNFVPRPKVDASVLQFTPLENTADYDLEALKLVTRSAFGQRRKMLRASLKKLDPEILSMIAQSGGTGEMRPQDLEPAFYLKLSRLLVGNDASTISIEH